MDQRRTLLQPPNSHRKGIQLMAKGKAYTVLTNAAIGDVRSNLQHAHDIAAMQQHKMRRKSVSMWNHSSTRFPCSIIALCNLDPYLNQKVPAVYHTGSSGFSITKIKNKRPISTPATHAGPHTPVPPCHTYRTWLCSTSQPTLSS